MEATPNTRKAAKHIAAALAAITAEHDSLGVPDMRSPNWDRDMLVADAVDAVEALQALLAKINTPAEDPYA